MFCPYCGAERSAEASFCASCGRQLAAQPARRMPWPRIVFLILLLGAVGSVAYAAVMASAGSLVMPWQDRVVGVEVRCDFTGRAVVVRQKGTGVPLFTPPLPDRKDVTGFDFGGQGDRETLSLEFEPDQDGTVPQCLLTCQV